MWKKLGDQFQKKTWMNKLELRCKLYSLRLKDGDSVQEHVKEMTEIFNGLSVIGDSVSDEDRVVHLLASSPDSFNMIVTALEANPEVPEMEVVTGQLLHGERKLRDRQVGKGSGGAMAARHQSYRRGPRCHICQKFGHIKRYCKEYEEQFNPALREKRGERKGVSLRVNKVEVMQRDGSSSASEHGMVTCHALSASVTHPLDSWIVDSGATCHMCNDKGLLAEFVSLKSPLEITLGDGHVLQAIGHGKVSMQMKWPGWKRLKSKLHDMLYVQLSYNLFSEAAEAGKVTRFNESGCQIIGAKQRLIATGTRVGSLYYLDHQTSSHQFHAVTNGSQEKNEEVWHGHLGKRNLQKLAKDNLVDDFDYDTTKEVSFCEPCANGKHHHSSFPTSGTKRAEEPLGLVHSDRCVWEDG